MIDSSWEKDTFTTLQEDNDQVANRLSRSMHSLNTGITSPTRTYIKALSVAVAIYRVVKLNIMDEVHMVLEVSLVIKVAKLNTWWYKSTWRQRYAIFIGRN